MYSRTSHQDTHKLMWTPRLESDLQTQQARTHDWLASTFLLKLPVSSPHVLSLQIGIHYINMICFNFIINEQIRS
jgi:hypothetical protein